MILVIAEKPVLGKAIADAFHNYVELMEFIHKLAGVL